MPELQDQQQSAQSAPVDMLGQPYIGGDGGAQGGQPANSPTSDPLRSPTVYDPNSPTPYQPVPTQQVIPQPATLPAEDNIPNLGAAGHAGAIAYIGDKLLRGYMNGSAQKQVRDAVNLQRQQQAAAANYDQTAQRLIQMKQAGVDANSLEYQAANDQKDAAFKSLTDMWDQHVQKMTTDPKTGKPVVAKGNLLQRMFNHQDPMQVAPAWVEAMKKNGPPVNHVLAQMDTPEYQAKVQARAATGGAQTQAAAASADVNAQRAQNDQELQQLMTSQAPLTADQEARKTQLMNAKYMIPSANMSAATASKAATWSPVPGGKFYKNEQGQWSMPVRNGLTGAVSERVMPSNFTPPPTAQTVPKQAWIAVDDGKGGKKIVSGRIDQSTNQLIPGSINTAVQPPTSVAGSIHTGNYMYTDAQGLVHQVPVSTSTRPAMSATGEVTLQGQPDQQPSATTNGQPSTAETPANGTAAAASGSATAATPPVHPAVQQGQSAGLQHVRQVLSATSNMPGRIIGNKGAADDDPQIDYLANQVHMGLATLASVPAAMKPAVINNLAKNNLSIGTKDTASEKASEDQMRDLGPMLDKTMQMLEPVKDKGGWTDSLGQRANWFQYSHGKDAGPLVDALNQYTAFLQIAGTSPFSKVGKSKLVFQTAMQHLPDPSKDSPGLMYRKIKDVQDIYNTQLSAAAERHQQGSITPQNIQQVQSQQQPATNVPPLATLKAGHITTYGDGSQWRLNSSGQPEQVKPPATTPAAAVK